MTTSIRDGMSDPQLFAAAINALDAASLSVAQARAAVVALQKPAPPAAISMADHGYMLGNMGTVTAASLLPVYANVVDQARGFSDPSGSYAYTPLDPRGWPTKPCKLILSTGTTAYGGNVAAGRSYPMEWVGESAALPDIGAGFTITDKRTVAGITTAVLNVTANTVIQIQVTPPMTDLRIMRPGLSLEFRSLWAPEGVAYLKQFSGLRYMKCSHAEHNLLPEGTYTLAWNGGGTVGCGALYGTIDNGGQSPCTFVCRYGLSVVLTGIGMGAKPDLEIVRAGHPADAYSAYRRGTGTGPNYHFQPQQNNLAWADLPPVDSHSAAGTMNRESMGLPLEHQIALSNELFRAAGSNFKTAWFTIHHSASDEFIAAYATALRDAMDPGIRIIVELSNETWNMVVYGSYWYQYWQAASEVERGNSDLAYDGSVVPTTHRPRLHARRTREMALLVQAVFGSEFGSRVRIALCGQLGGTGLLLDQLKYLEETYRLRAPREYVHILAPSTYSNITHANVQAATSADALVATIDTDPLAGRPLQTATVGLWSEIAAVFGIDSVAVYEAGPGLYPSLGLGGVDAAHMAYVAQAHDSEAMKAHIQGQVHDLLSKGAKEVCYYNISSGPPYTDPLISSNGNNFWHATTALTGAVGKKLEAVQALLGYPVPLPSEISARHAAPGRINPALFIRHDGAPPHSWPALKNIGWSNSAVGVARWVEYALFVRVAKPYTMTPSIRSHADGVFRVLIDGAQAWTSGPVNTGGYIAAAAAIAQDPVVLSLTHGWHRVRLEMVPSALDQYGFGPVVFE